MRILLGIVSLLFGITVHAAPPPDSELQRLTSALEKAQTQTDMNIASQKLCEFWDAKLLLLEKKVATKLGPTEQKRFADLKRHWREYRSREIAFRADFFDGGSIQPLIANCAYSEITEHRINELESLCAVVLNHIAEPNGAANGTQPIRSATNRTSSAAGSRR